MSVSGPAFTFTQLPSPSTASTLSPLVTIPPRPLRSRRMSTGSLPASPSLPSLPLAPIDVVAEPRAPAGPAPGPVDNSHPLKLLHDGKLGNIAISKPGQLASLKAKRQEFHGFLNALVDVPGGAGTVTAFRYQFSKKRVIYYAGGTEHILKLSASTAAHNDILACVHELEDIVFQIRGARILDTSYSTSDSVILTGDTSPDYKVITPVLTKLEKSKFGEGILLAQMHYRSAHAIPNGPQGPRRMRSAIDRLSAFNRRIDAEINRLRPTTDAVDKKKLAALKELKDKLDKLNGRDGYQLAWALLIDNGERSDMITSIETERGHIERQWATESIEKSKGADHIASEQERRKNASFQFSADIAGLVFAKAFPDNVDKARIANEHYHSKHGIYGEQRAELEFLMDYLATGRVENSNRSLAALLKGLSATEAQDLANVLMPGAGPAPMDPSPPPAPPLEDDDDGGPLVI